MKHNLLKRLSMLLLAVLLFATMPVLAAADNVDLAKTGSITVQLRDVGETDKPIGGTIRLHKVGDASVVDHNLTFTLTSAFAPSGVSLENVNAAGLADTLAAYADANSVPGTLVTADSTGKAAFTGLSAGLYLVSQETAVRGYYKMSPFLVNLPMTVNSAWVYDVEAAPKVESPKYEFDLTVRKVWQDNNKDRPKEITVQLISEGKVVDEVVLSRTNSWRHTWKKLSTLQEWEVRELPLSSDYSVTYTRSRNTITITNKASWYNPGLLQTGQLNWPVPVLFGAGLLFMVLGVMLLKKREKQDYEA